MLTKSRKVKGGKSGGRFAIVASKYNGRYVNSMLKAAKAELAGGGADEVRVVRVPGAYEIPVVVGALARQSPHWDAIICLGVILRGATTHAQHIGDAVSLALADVQVREGVPVIHDVLLFEDVEQAKVRCLDKDFNRGNEAAQTAMEMARVMRSL
jgi:6,7-dimethyl-8-ribityllumazine synthase